MRFLCIFILMYIYTICIFILLLLFFTDMIFAATLLEKAKLNYNKFLNCKDTHNSSSQKNIMVNDNNKSNTNTTNIAGSNNENIFYDTISDSEDIYNNVISNNTNENPLQDNTTSDIENNSDDTGKLKVIIM